eukprot:28711_1
MYYLIFFLLFEIAVKGLPDGLNSWTVKNEWANTPYVATVGLGVGYNRVQNTVWFFGGYIDSCCQLHSNYIVKFNVSSNTFEYNPSTWQLPLDFSFVNSGSSSTTVNDIAYLSPRTYESNGITKRYFLLNEPEPIYKFDMTQEQWFNVPETYLPTNHYEGCIYGEETQNILVVTGGETNTASMSYYNLTSGSWSLEITQPSVNIARNNHKCIISNDYLYIMGGYTISAPASPASGPTNTIERLYIMDILNIINYQWHLLQTTLFDNSQITAFGINADPSGNLYMSGGVSNGIGITNAVAMLNIRTLLIEKSLPLPVTNLHHVAVTTRDNSFYLFGGHCRDITTCNYALAQYIYSNTLPTKSPTPYIQPDQFYNAKYVLGGFTSFDMDVTMYNFDTLQRSYSEANTFCQNVYGTTLAIIK